MAAKAVFVTVASTKAIDDIVRQVREVRPDVLVVSRARDANHARHLYEIGVTDAVPETIEASLQLSEAALIGVPLQPGPEFRPGVPVPLFSNSAFRVPGGEAHYDVAPDGERFLVPERLGGTRKLHFVQNWFAAFRN